MDRQHGGVVRFNQMSVFSLAVPPSFRRLFSETQPLIIYIQNYAAYCLAVVLKSKLRVYLQQCWENAFNVARPPTHRGPPALMNAVWSGASTCSNLPLAVCLKARTHIPGFVGIVGALAS